MNRHTVVVRLITVMAVLAGVAVAACGSSGSSSSSAPAGATQTSRSQSTSTATATATATVTASSSTASTSTSMSASSNGAGTPPCTASRLAASFLGGQGATGHGELGFALRNTGSDPCHTYGYPGIQFASASGAPLPTKPDHTTSDFFGTLPLKALTVPAGQSFSFRLGVSHGSGSPAGCSTAHSIAIIPPDDTVALHVTIPSGAIECGTTTVSPVQPGVTAYH